MSVSKKKKAFAVAYIERGSVQIDEIYAMDAKEANRICPAGYKIVGEVIDKAPKKITLSDKELTRSISKFRTWITDLTTRTLNSRRKT